MLKGQEGCAGADDGRCGRQRTANSNLRGHLPAHAGSMQSSHHRAYNKLPAALREQEKPGRTQRDGPSTPQAN